MYVEGGAVTKGLSIGKYSSTAGDGLPQVAAGAWLNGMFSDDGGVAQTSGVARCFITRHYLTKDHTTASCDLDVIRGHLKTGTAVANLSGDAASRSCVRGYLETAHTTGITVGAGAFLASVMGEIWSDGNITATGKVAGVMSRIYFASGKSGSSTLAAFMATKQWSSAAVWPYGLYIDAATIDIRLQGGPCIKSGAGAPSGTATKGTLYLRSDGTGHNQALYLNVDGSSTWEVVTSGS